MAEFRKASPIWAPDSRRVESALLTSFAAKVQEQYSLTLSDYATLHAWSIQSPDAFWSSVWDFCNVVGDRGSAKVLVDGNRFPGALWFPDAHLNFARNLLRYRDEQIALVGLLENGRRRQMSYSELYAAVAQLAASLRADGVRPGDRVVGFMPNIVETVVAMLAATSIGAVWSSCSPDFGTRGAVDRFGQIRPKVLFAADGYYYNNKTHDCLERVCDIVGQIEGIQRVVIVPLVNAATEIRDLPHAVMFDDYLDRSAFEIVFEELAFDHPLYVMYSSGTTGPPKCIIHSAGGALLEHLKEHQLHTDLKRSDKFFYFTTCGWMMWNWLVSGLASGATIVLYDGSPLAGDGSVLLDAIDQEGITIFGASPKYFSVLEKTGKTPALTHRLETLHTLLSTGSPLLPSHFDYIYEKFKGDVLLGSISGGTDILGCFVGSCPVLPVYRGEIQAIGLGMAVEFWDETGNPVIRKKGELVCTRPFPSCPTGFWGDIDGQRFRAAYFERFDGVWAHGDYGEITENGGIIIYGRSDTVLNPGGVRIGTAEIYRQVEQIDEIVDSIVIGQEWEGDVRVILFVVLRDDLRLDDALIQRIKAVIRKETTPRHVPSKIVQVTDIPRTISGKIAELAVRDVVHGREVANLDALANPDALDQFRNRPELDS